jgi:hypothetical protein
MNFAGNFSMDVTVINFKCLLLVCINMSLCAQIPFYNPKRKHLKALNRLASQVTKVGRLSMVAIRVPQRTIKELRGTIFLDHNYTIMKAWKRVQIRKRTMDF